MFNQSKKECNTQVKRNYDNDFCVRYLVTLKSMCRSALSNQYEGTRRADSIPMISANQLALPLVHPAGTSKDSEKCDLSKNSDLYTCQWTDVDITSF